VTDLDFFSINKSFSILVMYNRKVDERRIEWILTRSIYSKRWLLKISGLKMNKCISRCNDNIQTSRTKKHNHLSYLH